MAEARGPNRLHIQESGRWNLQIGGPSFGNANIRQWTVKWPSISWIKKGIMHFPTVRDHSGTVGHPIGWTLNPSVVIALKNPRLSPENKQVLYSVNKFGQWCEYCKFLFRCVSFSRTYPGVSLSFRSSISDIFRSTLCPCVWTVREHS